MVSVSTLGRTPTGVLAIATKVSDPSDPLSTYLYARCSGPVHEACQKYLGVVTNIGDVHSPAGQKLLQETAASVGLGPLLATDFNRIIQGECVYEKQRFQHVDLSPATRQLLKKRPQDESTSRLNWMLLRDAFGEIARGSVVAEGGFTGIFKRREQFTSIEICADNLAESDLRDLWIALSPTNRTALADLTEDKFKELAGASENVLLPRGSYRFKQYTFHFEHSKLVRLSGFNYPDSDRWHDPIPLRIGSAIRQRELSLPCTLPEFEGVFGKADQVDRGVVW